MKFYRIDQGIDIANLNSEANKRDHSIFVKQRIDADGGRLDICVPGYFDKSIERWKPQGRDKLVKRATKALIQEAVFPATTRNSVPHAWPG